MANNELENWIAIPLKIFGVTCFAFFVGGTAFGIIIGMLIP